MESKFSPPLVIEFPTDGTVVEFQSVSKDRYIYKYTKASPRSNKLGSLLVLTQEQIIKIVKTNQIWTTKPKP